MNFYRVQQFRQVEVSLPVVVPGGVEGRLGQDVDRFCAGQFDMRLCRVEMVVRQKDRRGRAIGVDLSGTYAFGATIADFWSERGEKDNARIAYEVDADRFFKLMLDPLRD